MHVENPSASLRRSSRIPAVVPIRVTSLDGAHFSEMCETLVVNAHGCAIRARAKFDPGVQLHFHTKEGRMTTARVVSCKPMESDSQSWRLGAKLDHPGNFWGLQSYPTDWTAEMTSALASGPQQPATSPKPPAQLPAAAKNEPLKPRPQFSAEDVQKMIVVSVQPLQAEITSLKEKLARSEAPKSKFEVSLGSIPSELEQQLEQRLRQELGPKVLDEARQQSSRVLSATKEAVKKIVIEVHDEFQRRSKQELGVVEQRAGEVAAHIVDSIREQLRDGMGDMQRKLADGRNQLVGVSDELLTSLQANLNNEYNTRRGELEQIRSEIAAESLRLHGEVEQLDARIKILDDAVQSWETNAAEHLHQIGTEAVSKTAAEIERIVDSMLQELNARGAQALETQVDDAAGNLRIVQKGIIASVSDSLKSQSADASQEFEHSMDEMIQLSLERCRQKLASGLTAVVKNLGEQFQIESTSAAD